MRTTALHGLTVFSVALALAACAGDDTSTSETASSTTPSTSNTTQTATTNTNTNTESSTMGTSPTGTASATMGSSTSTTTATSAGPSSSSSNPTTSDPTNTSSSSSDPTNSSSGSSSSGGVSSSSTGSLIAEIPETCEEAEMTTGTVGCLFYGIDMDAHDLAETLQYAISIANVQLMQDAEVVIERKQGNNWVPIAGPATIAALDLQTFNLPNQHTDDSEFAAGNAYRITSDYPVIAYQFNPINGQSSFLSDASMLYPVPALDTVNDVVAWQSMLDNTNNYQHSYASVIATKDGTTVTVTPSVPTKAGNGVPAGQPGVPFDIDMNEGDVLSVAVTDNSGNSMTGTRFETPEDFPIALFAGQECALIPNNVCCCDHMQEQLSGVRLWGKNFIAARQPNRDTNNPETSLWQVYSAGDDNMITFTADPGVTGVPNNQVLQKGDFLEFYVGGPANEPGDFQIESDKAIAVVNYMTGSQNMQGPLSNVGDPAAAQTPPVEQFLPRYVVLVPGTWVNDILVITRMEGATVNVDGVAVADNLFNPVGMSGWEVARVPVPDGVHVLDGGDDEDPFGVVVVGYDTYDSYAYVGGVGTEIINPVIE